MSYYRQFGFYKYLIGLNLLRIAMKHKRLALILGDSLYSDHSSLKLDKDTVFFMAEDYGLCSKYKYHKHKLVLILSAMRSHRDTISKNHKIEYFDLNASNIHLSYENKLNKVVKKHNIKEIATYHVENHSMRERIISYCKNKQVRLLEYNSPGFLTSHNEFGEYRDSYNRLFMNDFYKWQRKRLNMLVDHLGKPEGGKWSFDAENRKKLPKKIIIPEIPKLDATKHRIEVSNLIEELFAENPGSTENFYLPTTKEQALFWLEDFLKMRFSNFGPYEDSISRNEGFIFHSILSPIMNIGLLTPNEVLESCMKYRKTHEIPLQSLEGFVRQIIGWREFVRGVYHTENLRGNFFNNQRKLTKKWYSGETGLPPLDMTIKRVTKNAYAHHIERLMIISNLMLLAEIHPDQVYKWFMELFVDSASWVMMPNVYGMGQFADGGTFATKPYISGSSYILKMSDFKREEWCDIWDGLYWRFIDKHRKFFDRNQRMSIMVKMVDKLDKKRKIKILKLADNFIEEVTTQ